MLAKTVTACVLDRKVVGNMLREVLRKEQPIHTRTKGGK